MGRNEDLKRISYYFILILTPKDNSGHDDQSESVYFGENERLMQVGFSKAVRKAQQISEAEYVVVWDTDRAQLVKVRIEYETFHVLRRYSSMSIDTIQDIHLEEKDGQFIAMVPKIGATVTGATHDEAFTNALRAITAAMIAEAGERKRHSRG